MPDFNTANKISDLLRAPLLKAGKITLADNGATVLPKNKTLSRGCKACKTGSWICIYIGTRCNLKCVHCPQLGLQASGQEYIRANGGDDRIFDKEDLARTIKRNPHISGISFSGGEPFLYLDLMYEWLEYINERWPDIYLWVYTNGVRVTEKAVKRLISLNVQEIRFDLAATDYQTKTLHLMDKCKSDWGLPVLTVEVPVISSQVELLLNVLPELASIGVDFLNLHELQLFDDNRERLLKSGVDTNMLYYNKGRVQFDLESMFNIYRIINFIEEYEIPLSYNDCSSRNYVQQSLGFQFQRNNMDVRFKRESWGEFLERAEAEGSAP